ncbi:hypothetical protein [Marinobacterium litorale]|uniref:hypothetical protein n=1 Tax=Marinobacterium litorale TaxID=404770 RepID=UPI000484757C|nr:hypothetical protein [Marinobacterium litorale]
MSESAKAVGRTVGEMQVTIDQQAAEIERLNAALKKQAAAAKTGMDAAKRASNLQLEEAKRLRAESSPEALESERAANDQLTAEIERLRGKLNKEIDAAADANVRLILAEQERDQLKAVVNSQLITDALRLMRATSSLSGWHEKADELESVINSPNKALAAHEAEVLERVANELAVEASGLPSQHENKSRGSSTYNWQMHFVRRLIDRATQLRTSASAEEVKS